VGRVWWGGIGISPNFAHVRKKMRQTYLCLPNYSKLNERAIYEKESNAYQTFMNAYYLFHYRKIKYGASKQEVVAAGNIRWKTAKNLTEEQLVFF
jgi:hypothetical protein